MPALDPVVPLRFVVEELPEAAVALRAEVRSFLAEEIAAGAFVPHCDAWLSAPDKAFSRFTLRLWSWRDEFGTEEEWASVLGGLLKENLWETLA